MESFQRRHPACPLPLCPGESLQRRHPVCPLPGRVTPATSPCLPPPPLPGGVTPATSPCLPSARESHSSDVTLSAPPLCPGESLQRRHPVCPLPGGVTPATSPCLPPPLSLGSHTSDVTLSAPPPLPGESLQRRHPVCPLLHSALSYLRSLNPAVCAALKIPQPNSFAVTGARNSSAGSVLGSQSCWIQH